MTTLDKIHIGCAEGPLPQCYYPQLWNLLQQFSHQTLGDICPKSLDELIAKDKRDVENGSKDYIAFGTCGAVGFIWAESVGDDLAMGHLVFEREGITSREKVEATREAIECMFRDGFRKIMWMFFADNRAFRIFLRKVGAVEEGILRQHTRRNGALVDAAFMASFPEGAQ
jgi:hypothetical protein